MEAAVLITECLERRFRAANASVTGLRASALYQMGDDGCSWPVVEWREGSETEAIAAFIVETTRLPFSHVMLFGVGMGWQRGGRRFKQTFLEFQVASMQHLGNLLGVMQRVLGIPYWRQPEPEVPTLCLAGDPEYFTAEQ